MGKIKLKQNYEMFSFASVCDLVLLYKILKGTSLFSLDHGLPLSEIKEKEMNKFSVLKTWGSLKHTILYFTIPCHTIPYHAIPYHTMPYHTIPYRTIPYHTMPSCCM